MQDYALLVDDIYHLAVRECFALPLNPLLTVLAARDGAH